MNYVFDDFQLNTDTHQLTCNGEPVLVEPQTFALLHTLIANHNTVLSKDDLVDAVWQGRLTSDAAIASRIKLARKAIGDDGKAQRYIKTLHCVGYRFIGSLRTGTPSPDRPTKGVHVEQANSQEQSRPVVLIRAFEEAKVPPSGDIVAGGLTHDVISGLSRLRWLKVISWASVLRLKAESDGLLKDLTAADYSLAGTLERSGSRLILALELTDLRDQSIIWADRIRAGDGDVGELQSAVVQQVVSTLELQISSAEAARAQYLQTSNLDAWSSYHLGMLHMYRFNAADNAAAVVHFQRAVDLHPEFARAHAGLSFAQFLAAFNRYSGADEATSRRIAQESAERSVQLDSMDPLANFVRGRSFWLDGDIAAGLPWLERALQLNSSFAQGHYSLGLATLMLDDAQSERPDQHLQADSAISLSPLDPLMYGFYGLHAFAFLRDGKLKDAQFWANRAARQPNAVPAMDFIAAATNCIAGDLDRARGWAARARERSGNADSSHFFRALPFEDGPLRDQLEGAFRTLKLAPSP
ncbi:MAG: winged helix-turn-helix domain-containing protein [Pseudomonadota bacterium]